MRKAVSVLWLVIFLAAVSPAQAQLRNSESTQQSPVRIFDGGQTAMTLNKLFSPQHFRMSHTYEFSTGSFGGNSGSLGMYTNTMMWQFNEKLAARVDLSYAHEPFGGNLLSNSGGQGVGGGQFFLRNAELAYKPSENVMLHFSVRQSPYGAYMNPYGYYGHYGHYGYGSYHSRFSSRTEDLFWNSRER